MRAIAEADGVSLYWWDEEQRVLAPLARTGWLLEKHDPPIVHPGQGILGAAYEQRQPLLVESGYATSRFTTTWGRDYGIEAIYAVPLIVRRRVSGVLIVMYAHARTIEPGLRRVIDLVARQIAPTLTVIRLLAEAERSVNESVTLAKLIRDTATHVDVNSTCARITETACRIVGAEYAAVGVHEGERIDRFYGVWGARTALWKPGFQRHTTGFIAEELARGRTVSLTSLSTRADLEPAEFTIARAEGACTLLLTPLGLGGQPLGWLHVGWRVDVEPTLRQIALIEALAKHAATIVAHSREIERIVVQHEQHSCEEHYRALAEHASDLVIVFDGDRKVRYASPSHAPILGAAPQGLLGRDILDFVVREDRSAVKQHLTASFAANTGRIEKFSCRVRHADGSTRVLEGWGVDKSADALIGGWLLHGRDRTVETQAAASLVEVDPLARLLDRSAIENSLHVAAVDAYGGRSTLALLAVELGQFGEVVRGAPEQVARRLLRDVGDRLRSVVRGGHRLGRIGADEFVIVMPHAGEESARECVDAVLEVMNVPFNLAGQAQRFTVHIGVALYPEHGLDAKTLLRRANAAVRAAKRAASDFSFYRTEHDQSATARVVAVSALREAISTDQLTLHYQPIFDVRTKEVVQAEALCRWPGGPREMRGPDEFIPLAEHAGLMGALTDWVVRSAVTQWGHWGAAAPSCLAINVSMENLCEPGLADRFDRIFASTGIKPSTVCLELTESALMVDVERSVRTLEELAGLGVRFGIDDFGTGYTSLSYLKRFSIHELKIDRSFVTNVERDPHDAAIVRSIIDLAHGLGLAVVAEGVESPRALELLAEWGCDQAQGHILAPAMAADDFDWWFSRSGPGR